MIDSDNQFSRLKDVNKEVPEIEKVTNDYFRIEIDPIFCSCQEIQRITNKS